MTPFCALSFIGRSALGLWTFLLCIAEIVGVVLSCAVRRYRNVLPFLPLFALSYLMWQATVCCLYMSVRELTSPLCIWLLRLPYLYWLLVLPLLTAGSAVILFLNIRYSKTFITPAAIERCVDELSCGICYWQDNGHVVFSNDCMNRLSTLLTGKPLMDGKRIRDAITDAIMPVGDRVWQFSLRDIAYGKEKLHELIASDVSEFYAESRALQADNDRLAKMNEELKEYGLKIDDTVRRQEMLQAKVNIHDEMNRLMLSTIAADLENEDELNRIFALWERNALFLCMESNEHRNEDAVKHLDELAQTLGIRILWNSDLLEKLAPKHRELFFTAAREAITNAVKHAKAKQMRISFAETPDTVCCTFENDGDIPKGDVRFTGGIANLSVLAGEQNASVAAEADETFRLSLIFRKNR